jgi:hypothetical protein
LWKAEAGANLRGFFLILTVVVDEAVDVDVEDNREAGMNLVVDDVGEEAVEASGVPGVVRVVVSEGGAEELVLEKSKDFRFNKLFLNAN